MTVKTYEIADNMKEFREQLRLTQADFAASIGFTRATVSAWEQGISLPSAEALFRIYKCYQVSIDSLLGIRSESFVDISSCEDYVKTAIYTLIQKSPVE